jgi:hypothetical protein
MLALAGSLYSSAGTAFAQTPSPGMRGDAGGMVGWLNGNKSEIADRGSNDWYNRGLYGAGIAGWYWTDHHKTEIEAAASNSARFSTYPSYNIDGLTAFAGSRFTFETRRIAVSQQYQFFRNEWFHPHVAAGADVTWETTTEDRDPVIFFGQQGQTRQIMPARVIGPDTRARVRPFAEVGFKAYTTPRGFFRGDLRLLARGRIDEVQLRFGFGVDF